MESAIFGLVGVVVGSLLTVGKEWWFKRAERRKNTEYLAAQIGCLLDQFVDQCCDVVNNNGTVHGQPDPDGHFNPQFELPDFLPLSVPVDWKSLPGPLMYVLLRFPREIGTARHSIASTFEFVANPLDCAEGFEERQMQFAALGIKAGDLATALRKEAGFASESPSEWDPVGHLRRVKTSMEKSRMAREQSQLKFTDELSPSVS
jgi:hypothetical protein